MSITFCENMDFFFSLLYSDDKFDEYRSFFNAHGMYDYFISRYHYVVGSQVFTTRLSLFDV